MVKCGAGEDAGELHLFPEMVLRLGRPVSVGRRKRHLDQSNRTVAGRQTNHAGQLPVLHGNDILGH